VKVKSKLTLLFVGLFSFLELISTQGRKLCPLESFLGGMGE